MKNMLTTAWRNIRHQKLHSVINIGGLAIAMTAVILIMLWVQNELRFDSHHPDADRIYLVKNYLQIDKNETWIWENSPHGLHAAITQQVPEAAMVTHIMRTQQHELTLRNNNNAFNIEWAIYADRNWFNVFQYHFLEGNADNLFAHPYSVALTASKARNIFGNTHVAGKTVLIDSTSYVVGAVLADNPVNSSFQFDVLIPLTAKLNTKARLDNAAYWGNFTYKTFVKLQPGASAAKATDKINDIFQKNRKELTVNATLLPIKHLHFDNSFQWSAFVHGNIKTVKIFTALAILLLLAAGINYVNLSIARAGLRTKEIGVRKIVGASRRHLFFQMMSESFLTSLIALLISVIMVELSLPFFNSFTGVAFSFNLFDSHIALLLGGVLVTILLLTGIYPALLLSAFNPLRLFRGTGYIRLKDVLLRKGLITVQFVFAVVMTVAAIVIYKQLRFIQQQSTAYNEQQIFTVRVPDKAVHKVVVEKNDVLVPVKNELLSNAAIQYVSRMNNGSIVDNPHVVSGDLDWEGKPSDYEPSYTDFAADKDLNSIMQFEFVQGHWFTGDGKDVILNEAAIKQFGIREPVIGLPFDGGKIIGVVKDFHYRSMHEKIGPVVIRLRAGAVSSFLVSAVPGQAITALEATKKVWAQHFPGEPFHFSFMDEEFERLYREDRKALSFTMAFSGLSIFISCIGLLGLVTLVAAQRKKEIGIRKVLGAGVGSLVTLISKDFLKLVVIAICIATPLAWLAMNKWLEDFAYRIELQWWMFLLAGIIAIAIAFITIGFQSVKAALSNPVKSLRTE